MIKIERNKKNGEVIKIIDLRPTKFKDETICDKSKRVLKEANHPSKHSFARHCRQKGDPRLGRQ